MVYFIKTETTQKYCLSIFWLEIKYETKLLNKHYEMVQISSITEPWMPKGFK